MIKLYEEGIYLLNGSEIIRESRAESLPQLYGTKADREAARKGTISWGILKKHNLNDSMDSLSIRFDALTSHDITYVNIIQTARASGMDIFPVPYILTCCHNSLGAVGGTINEDDHMFGLSAAQKYGGIYVPPHLAVIHQYMREMYAGCGDMILGSDSHTRYGALGTVAVGEGGGELTRQILGDTWDIPYPEVVAVYLKGKPMPWVGPMDIALALCKAVYKNSYVKNKIMEFVGPGVSSIPVDYRSGIDVMTTETACLSSVWRTDTETEKYLKEHGRPDAYKQLDPSPVAYYDGCILVDLSEIKPMIAMPFHPSNAYEIDELIENLEDILHETEIAAAAVSQGCASYTLLDKVKNGRLRVQQGIIAGCAGGTFSNITEASSVLCGKQTGSGPFSLSIYPASAPVYMDLARKGILASLTAAGAVIRTAFCGPCFGAGDTPPHNGLSVRHTTRNFPNREGSKPGSGQMSAVALMDSRSIAATAVSGGLLTSAEEYADLFGNIPEYFFDTSPYQSRVYSGFGKAQLGTELFSGPNIKAWPDMPSLTENVLLKICSKILDDVTTTDELIPSGETSSYRSNPLALAEYTLSRRDPDYVGKAKATAELEGIRAGKDSVPELVDIFRTIHTIPGQETTRAGDTRIGSVIYATRPGDGSAREQAASCQRVLGGLANIAQDYATKRYRSNVINWGMIPFRLKDDPGSFDVDDYIYVPGIMSLLQENRLDDISAYVIRGTSVTPITLFIDPLTEQEREIIEAGSLINYNRNRMKEKMI